MWYLKCLKCNEVMENFIRWERKSNEVNEVAQMYPSLPMIAQMWQLYNESGLYIKVHDGGDLEEFESICDWVSFHHQHPIIILDNKGNVCTEAIEYMDDDRILQLAFVATTPEQQSRWDALPIDRRDWQEAQKQIQLDMVTLDVHMFYARSKAMTVAQHRGLVPKGVLKEA